jgi:hypothetical protein
MDMGITQKRRRQRLVTHSVTDPKMKPQKKRAYIPRRTRKFQLRTTHPEDIHVGQILDYARTKRQEVTMIRQGVMLEHSLQRGDVSLLLERHPWVLEALKPLISPPDSSGGGGDMDEIKGMFEMLIANQRSSNTYSMQSAQPAQPAALPELPAVPKAEVKQAAATVTADDIASNFLSMFQ